MEQINKSLQEVALTLTNTEKKLQPLREGRPDWLPSDCIDKFNNTDLEYHPFCTELFAKLEAAKRDNFPKETMRIWFIEFIRAGWTKQMVLKRYNALLSTKIYGVEKIEFADWVNAVPVYAEDEVRLMVKQRIDTIIQKGRWLLSIKDTPIKLTEEEQQAIDVAVSKELEFQRQQEKLNVIDEARELRREFYRKMMNEKHK